MKLVKKIWQILPRLTQRIYEDHAEAGMVGSHHDPEHAIRVAQMALEIGGSGRVALRAGAAGLCHNADRILQHKLKLDLRQEVPKERIRQLIESELGAETSVFTPVEIGFIIDAVLKHDGKNDPADSPELVVLMDADRLVNAEPDLIIRSAQLYNRLPPLDPLHFWSDPDATFRDPKSVLYDIMQTVAWLTPGTPFYVRLPKAREIAGKRKKFFDDFGEQLIACRRETGFHPYPKELIALRARFVKA